MKASTLNLKVTDFGFNGVEYIAKNNKIGYTSRFDKKFKAPKVINIENVGTFTLRTYWDHQLTGRRFFYQSDMFGAVAKQDSLRIMFW